MSADGTSLLNFGDFVMATKPHKITPTTDVLNDTAKNYYLLGDMIKGRGNDEVVQNGSSIIDMVRLDRHNAAGFYRPNENLQPRGMDILTKLTANWRFHQGNYAWTEEQVKLNGANTIDNWVKLVKAWRDAARQDAFDTMEDALFAEPDQETMETENGKQPYSLLCFITDNGLAPSGFTTVMGVNPTTKKEFRNQVETYDAANYDTTVYSAFDRMWHKLNWQTPPRESWAEGTDWAKFKILTDLNGITKYLAKNRDSNDRLSPMNDPGTYAANPRYNGIPLKRINTLDDKLYTNPKYLWLDSRYIFPVYHTEKYLDEGDPIRGGVNQPFSWAVFTNTYYNLFCRSRKRQGIIVAA